ncbi:MAG TPA: hypothetical protein VF541_09870 [Longimicrobium sp.]
MMKPLAISTLLVAAVAGCARDAGDGDAAAAPPSPPVTATDPAPTAAPADTAGVWVLDEHGVGPVRVGMRVAQADTATPGGLDRTTNLEPECDVLQPKHGLSGLSFMVADARVVRVEARDSARVATRAGARLGDSEARIRQLYPAARVEPHKYDDRGHYIIVIPGAPADTLYRIVFETDGSVVKEMRGGLWPPVEYVEGCS